MQVAVIGCGPSGLAAAHAAYGLGADVAIYSPLVRSPQNGPLVLQRPIPGITLDHPDAYIRQIVIGGSILDYRYRVYGDININMSRQGVLKEGYHCWNHIAAYDTLWRKYIDQDNYRINKVEGMLGGLDLFHLQDQFDLVVNTAPLKLLCFNVDHEFVFKQVDVTLGYSYPDQPPDTTIFNAGNDFEWVRSAYLLGNSCTEWLAGTAPAGSEIHAIRKPISHNCNCFPRVLGTGRFGAWRNETWVDSAYYDTRDALVSMQRKPIWDQVK